MCVTNVSQGAITSLCIFARSTSSSGPQGTPVFGMSQLSPSHPLLRFTKHFLSILFQQVKIIEFDSALMSHLHLGSRNSKNSSGAKIGFLIFESKAQYQTK